jgi:hypothetical protein
MAHGVEPVLPFDLTHATFLAPKLDRPLTTEELIAHRARQLEKREGDLAEIEEKILKSRYASIAYFMKKNSANIRLQNFEPGTLVLIRNKKAEGDLGGKHLPRYFGPMIVVRRTKGGSYILGELDGTLSNTRYAAFRLLKYHTRDPVSIPITMVMDAETIEKASRIEDDVNTQEDSGDDDSGES